MTATAAAAVAALVLSAGALIFTALSSWAAACSAKASKRSANSADESVKIARAVSYREDTPSFKLRPIAPANGGFPVEVTMVSGPPGIKVEMAHYSGLAFGLADEGGGSDGRAFLGEGPSRPAELIRNDSFWLSMQVVEGAVRVQG
ncbi:MAG: hypothetical protein ABR608_03070 [Pseudonocardiaceae bacterium]